MRMCSTSPSGLAITMGVLIAAQLPGQASDQPQRVPIAATERRTLVSSVNRTEYQLDIALPDSYARSNARYPVLYSLVPEQFALLTESFRWVRDGYLIPQDIIIVSIGYPGWEYGSWSDANVRTRERDFGITEAAAARLGGPATFLRVLREDVIPFIDSAYRSAPDDRGLLGTEKSGVFAIYALLHAPDVFQKYAIGSPAIDLGPDWADPSTFKWETEYAATHTDLAARIYMYVGEGVDSWETLSRPPAERFWSLLRSRHYPHLNLTEFEVFPREGHGSVNLPAMGHALRSLYTPPTVSVSEATLRSYVGDWRSDSGNVLTLRVAHSHLVLFVEPFRRVRNNPKQILASELNAQSDTSFFSRGPSLDRLGSLVFERASRGGTVKTLVYTQPGSGPVRYYRVPTSAGTRRP